VARHLVAAGQLLDEDPEMALAHARAARRLAPRIAAVREALGLAAYRNGEWQTAIGELRTYHRLTGRQTHLAVLADCERALGRPERAIDMYRTADKAKLSPEEAVELLIVAAGARGDMGQRDAAVAMLQVRELTSTSREPWIARLRYAYAEALLAAGRREEAREWFARAADVDDELATDAAERLLDLDGVVLDDVNDEDLDDEDLDDDIDEEAEFVDVDEAELDDETDETDDYAAEADLAKDLGPDAPAGPDLEDETPDRVDADLDEEDLDEEDLDDEDLEAGDQGREDQRHGADVDLDPEVKAKSADSATEPAVPEARFDPGTGAERTDREQG
jgi:tetratricopeptide (TPR) repeat protein